MIIFGEGIVKSSCETSINIFSGTFGKVFDFVLAEIIGNRLRELDVGPFYFNPKRG